MKKLFFFLLVLCLSVVHAEIYKWVDSDGNIHYGDQPDTAAAKPMKNLPDLSTYSPPDAHQQAKPPLSTPQSMVTPVDAGASPAASTYRNLSIVSPEEEGTVRSSPGTVPVFVALAPVLRKGDYLKVILDGKTLPTKYSSTVITLKNVDRGEHKLAVAVYSRQGKELLKSGTRTFYLHRTIAKKKPQPKPTPKPQPKPQPG